MTGARFVLAISRAEIAKLFRHLGFWVVLLLFFVGEVLVFWQAYGEAARHEAAAEIFGAPGGWLIALRYAGKVTLSLSSGVVVFFTASELSWGTAARLVSNGLPRTWFMIGKLVLATSVALVFSLVNVVAIAPFVYRESGFAILAWSNLPVSTTVVFVLAAVGYNMLALLAALLVPSAAGALAAWISYVWLVEPLVADYLAPAVRDTWLPLGSLNALWNTSASGGLPPVPWATTSCVGGLYVALAVAIAFIAVARRDL